MRHQDFLVDDSKMRSFHVVFINYGAKCYVSSEVRTVLGRSELRFRVCECRSPQHRVLCLNVTNSLIGKTEQGSYSNDARVRTRSDAMMRRTAKCLVTALSPSSFDASRSVHAIFTASRSIKLIPILIMLHIRVVLFCVVVRPLSNMHPSFYTIKQLC